MTDTTANVKFNIQAVGVAELQDVFTSVVIAAKRAEEAISSAQKAGSTRRRTTQEKEEKDRTKITDKEEKARISTSEKASKDYQRMQERKFAALKRELDKSAREEVAAEKRKNSQIEAESKKTASKRASFARGLVSNVGGSLRGAMGVATKGLAVLGAVGGGYSIADSVGQAISNSGKAKEISINSGNTISQKEVLSKAQEVAVDQGFTTDQVLGGADAFIAKTGDAKTAMSLLKQIGQIANATGTDFKDLSTTVALAWNSMSDSEKATKGQEGLMKMIRGQAGQGLAGALDMRDTEGTYNRVYNSAAQFKGGVTENAQYLGALTQRASMMGTASSAAEATESAKSLALDIKTHKKELAKAGFTGKDSLTDDYGNLKSMKDVSRLIMLKTHGDLGLMEKAGIERRSLHLYEGPEFGGAYTAAKKSGKSEKASLQAGLDAYDAGIKKFVDATLTAAEVEEKANQRKQEADKQLTMVFEDLRVKVGNELLPKIIEIIPALKGLIPTIVSVMGQFITLAQWMADNPIKTALIGVGAVIAKAVVAEVVAAGIKTALTEMASAIGITSAGLIAVPAAITAALVLGALAVKKHNEEEAERHNREAEDPGSSDAKEETYQLGILNDRKKRLEAEGNGKTSAPSLFGPHRGLTDDPNAEPMTDVTSEGSDEYQQTVKAISDINSKRQEKLAAARQLLNPTVKTPVKLDNVDEDPGSNPQNAPLFKAAGYVKEVNAQEEAKRKQDEETAETNKEAAKTLLSAAKIIANTANPAPPEHPDTGSTPTVRK